MKLQLRRLWPFSRREVYSGTCSCSGNELLYSHTSFIFGSISHYIRKCTISPEKLRLQFKQNKSRYRSASLTAEMAMALPLFFFTIYIFWQCFLLLLVQLSVCREVAEVTLTRASLGYVERTTEKVEDLSWLYESLVWQALLSEERVDDVLVSFEKTESGRIQGRVFYSFLCETALLPMIRIPVVQSISFLPYIGEYDKDKFEKEETSGSVVYVTKYGTVYHTVKSCGYLTVEVTAVDAKQIDEKRNSYGKKYSACDVCADDTEATLVYVSVSGTKYHAKAACPTLRRVFEEKRREEVTLPACSRCAEGGSET